MTKITMNRTLTQLLSKKRMACESILDETFDGSQRCAFETDGDKIVYTEGFRALADKTQVHDRTSHKGHHRNRLTHSIEVSRVGRSLGVALGARMISFHGLHASTLGETFWRVDPAEVGHVVAAACLAHDIGNPPFGHDGEDAIGAFFSTEAIGKKAVCLAGPEVGAELCAHEGNAQGFRMITRAMGWRGQGGLNLTAATLGAFGKYPFPHRPGIKKYGLHRADLEAMAFVAEATGMIANGEGWIRHPLAWLMEAADDICYLTVDLEDAAQMGIVEIDDLCALYRPIIGDTELAAGRALGDNGRMIQYLRSRMIKALINGCVEIYRDIAEDMDRGTLGKTDHGSGIIAHTRHAQSLKDIRSFSETRIYKSDEMRASRKVLGKAATRVLERMTQELIDHIAPGIVKPISTKASPFLASVPQAGLTPLVPVNPAEAFPWLLDQITLMSDSQMMRLAARAETL